LFHAHECRVGLLSPLVQLVLLVALPAGDLVWVGFLWSATPAARTGRWVVKTDIKIEIEIEQFGDNDLVCIHSLAE
ncbi:hypothetical protein LPJ66_011489, partial [Kickxella alabastrina]